MMSQKSLENYGYIEQVTESRSTPGTRHIVSKQDGQYFCSCLGFKWRSECYHILKARIEDIKERLIYYSKRKEVLSEAEFDSFDMAMERLSKNEEINYLCNLIILLARSEGTVNADKVYETIQGKFAGDPRRLGVAFGILSKKGIIEWVGRRKSERKRRHHGTQEDWRLTPTNVNSTTEGT